MTELRALWLRESTDPDYGALAPHRFTHLYRSIRDARTTIASLAGDRRAGYTNGVYWASTWDAGLSGSLAAAMLSARWVALGGQVNRLDVQLDAEQHDPVFVLDLLRAWRDLRSWCVTSWTMEGFQGGWVEAIRAPLLRLRDSEHAGVLLVPQTYPGGMLELVDREGAPLRYTPAEWSPHYFDPAGVIADLTSRPDGLNFPAASVVPFHDAATLYRGWYGFAFDSERLA